MPNVGAWSGVVDRRDRVQAFVTLLNSFDQGVPFFPVGRRANRRLGAGEQFGGLL